MELARQRGRSGWQQREVGMIAMEVGCDDREGGGWDKRIVGAKNFRPYQSIASSDLLEFLLHCHDNPLCGILIAVAFFYLYNNILGQCAECGSGYCIRV